MSDARQWTRTWMRRTLSRMPAFTEAGAAPADAETIVPPNDRVIGVYSNGPEPSQRVIVTEDSIVFHDEQWRRVRFAEITRTGVGLEQGKLGAERLQLERDGLPCGSVIISGGGERHRDVFEFLRFLDRVVAIHCGKT